MDLIDNSALEVLREQIGEANARTAIRQFVIESADLVEQLVRYKGDLATRKRAAHTLKSAAATFGMSNLQFIASEIEQAIDAVDRGRIAVLTLELEELSEELLAELRVRYVVDEAKCANSGLMLATEGE